MLKQSSCTSKALEIALKQSYIIALKHQLLTESHDEAATTTDTTWVTSDYTAQNTCDLSVSKGQQVEIVSLDCQGAPDYCLVRLVTGPTSSSKEASSPAAADGTSTHEGLVPVSILKPPPQAPVNDSTEADQASASPANRKRVFSSKKWLPLIRRSAPNKEKAAPEKIVPKKIDKKVKDKSSEAETETGAQEEEEPAPELPPPMKPIQDPTEIVGTANSTISKVKIPKDPEKKATVGGYESIAQENKEHDLAEIEQIVKEKMEKHHRQEHQSSSNKADGGSPSLSPEISENDNSEENPFDPIVMENILKKRMFALRELVTSEENYVQDLSLIVNGYIREIRDPESTIPIPEDLKLKERMVFGNVEAIYEWHKDYFLKNLQKCIEQPKELGPLIERSKRKLQMYVVYCQNKPVSEHIVSEYLEYFEDVRIKLGHKLKLCDLLIKPVQRIMKYELLLKDIFKYTKRARLQDEFESLKAACEVMRVIPKAANDMMDVGRLQKFEGKITSQGPLKLHGPLMCVENSPADRNSSSIVQKPRELQVFLFEQNMIFSDIIGRKTQFTSPTYMYRTHIQMNKLQVEDQSSPSNGIYKFVVRSTDPNREGLSIVCLNATYDNHRNWVENINSILEQQKNFLRAIQSPIDYQKKGQQ